MSQARRAPHRRSRPHPLRGAIPTILRAIALAALLSTGAGCGYRVVQPDPLVIPTIDGGMRVVTYPACVVAHSSESFWDPHQVKDNLVGLLEVDIVHAVDLGADALIPGPDRRPVDGGVEWLKNQYSRLPDCAPVRIVGGLFGALGIEKTTLIYIPETIEEPLSAGSYLAYTRVVYLTDWVQETVGEVNAAAGYLVPWEGPFVPRAATAPVNRAVDWAQEGAIKLYVYVAHKINVFVDEVIDRCERAWGRVVRVFARRRRD